MQESPTAPNVLLKEIVFIPKSDIGEMFFFKGRITIKKKLKMPIPGFELNKLK